MDRDPRGAIPPLVQSLPEHGRAVADIGSLRARERRPERADIDAGSGNSNPPGADARGAGGKPLQKGNGKDRRAEVAETELPTQDAFIPESVGSSGKPTKQREATTVEPRVYAHGIAIYVRAAYWIDKSRSKVMYIQSTDYERLKQYEQAIKRWFQSPNRSKSVPKDALARLGVHTDDS